MQTFLHYAAGVTVQPRDTFRLLRADPHRVAVGFGGLLSLSAAYGIGISIGLRRHPDWTPDRAPVLRIPPERYYTYERFFILPVAIAETLVTAGVVRLLAHAWNGQGRFEDLFALFGLSHTTLVLSMALPDAVEHFLSRRFRTRPYVYLGTLWMLALLVLAIRETEHLPWTQSTAIALSALLANAMVEYIFIR